MKNVNYNKEYDFDGENINKYVYIVKEWVRG